MWNNEKQIVEKKKLTESIENEKIRIWIHIKWWKYIFPYIDLFSFKQKKITREVIKSNFLLNEKISTLNNFHIWKFEIELEKFKWKTKKIKLLYSITKIKNNLILNIYKSFWKKEVSLVSIAFKKWETISKTIEFKREWKWWFDKDLNNLKLNITLTPKL